MSETQEAIKKQLAKLPKDLRDAVVAADLPDKFKTIANKHKLRIDQGGALENETMFVMLGLEHPDDYTSNLKREADISQEEAESIAEEINRMIFLPIRASLKKLHEDAKEEEEKMPGRIEHPPLSHTATKGPSAHPSAKTAEPQTPSAIKERLLQSSYDAEKTHTEHVPEQEDKKDIFRQKLEGPTRFAKEETQIDKPAATRASVPPRPEGAKSDPSRLGSPRDEAGRSKADLSRLGQSKADPYKEPIEEKDTRGIVQEGPVLPLKKSSVTPQSTAPLQTPEQKSKPAFKKTSAALPQQTVAQTIIPPKKKFSFDSMVQKPLASFDKTQDHRQATEVKSKEQQLQKSPVNQTNVTSADTAKKKPLSSAPGEKEAKAAKLSAGSTAQAGSSSLGDDAPSKPDASEKASGEEKITAPKWESGRERVTAGVKNSISKQSERVPPNSLSTPKKEVAHESETTAIHTDVQQLHKPAIQTAGVKSPDNNAKKISHTELTQQPPQIKPTGQLRPDQFRLDRSETDKTSQSNEAATEQAKEVEKKETKTQKPYETDPYREPIE